MGKPDQPKDIKPKTEGEAAAPKAKGGGVPIDDNMKVIIINLVTTVLICVLFLSVSYVLQSSLLDAKLAKVTTASAEGDVAAEGEGGGEGEDTENQKGFIVDLGDFILNLSDVAPRKYLKVNVALELSSKPEDAVAEAPKKEGHGEGGEGGGGAAASPLDAEMAQYKPAMRDAIITNLSSKTAAELSTAAGKELAKEQITEAVNSIFAGEREVLRVSFGQFIIQ